MHIVPSAVVDRLPSRLWRPGNLYLRRLHFCLGPHRDGAAAVRTVEWNGREVGVGRRPVDRATAPPE